MTDQPYPGTIITLTGSDLTTVIDAFKSRTVDPHTVQVWFDPIDGGVKFKFNNHTWSPALGQVAP